VVTAEDCIRWHAATIELDEASVAELAPLCIAPGGDRILLSYDIDGGATEFAFSLAEQPLAFRLAKGDASYAVEGLWPAIAADGSTSAAGIASLSARLSGGAVSSPDAGVALRGITGSAELRDGA